jgi:hypothetical protein
LDLATEKFRARLNTAVALYAFCAGTYLLLGWLHLRTGHWLDRVYTDTFYLLAVLEGVTILFTTPYGWVIAVGSLIFALLCTRIIHYVLPLSPYSEVILFWIAAALVGAIATVADSGNEPPLSAWQLPLLGGAAIGAVTAWWRRRVRRDVNARSV